MLKCFFTIAVALATAMPLSTFAAWPPELQTNQGNGNLEKAGTSQRVVLRGVGIKAIQRRDVSIAEYYTRWVTDPTFADQGLTGHHAKVIRLCMEAYNFDNGSDLEFGTRDFRTTAGLNEFVTFFDSSVLPVVQLCERKGVYCLLNLHYVSPFGDEDMTERLIPIWNFLSTHPALKNKSGVLFELFNEPIFKKRHNGQTFANYLQYNAKFTPAERWEIFRDYIQTLVTQIRRNGCRNLLVVGSSNWDTDFAEISVAKSLDGNLGGSGRHNILYNYHLYPKAGVEVEFKGDATFNRADTAGRSRGGADLLRSNLPVFITEFSWTYNIGASPQHGRTSKWGRPLRSYLDGTPLPSGTTSTIPASHRARISWTPWVFDPQRHGALLADYTVPNPSNPATATIKLNGYAGGPGTASREHYGWFIFDWLQDKRNADQP